MNEIYHRFNSCALVTFSYNMTLYLSKCHNSVHVSFTFVLYT